MSAESRPTVIFVTQYFAPERYAFTTDLAHALARHCEVRVITSQPNFPSGRIFPGFRWYGWGTRDEGGIQVTRVPTFPYRGLRIVARLLGYLTFGAFAAIAVLLSPRTPDVWVVYQTPLSSAWGVALARRLRGGRVVHLVADLWPESMLATGLLREGIVSRTVGRTRRWTNRLADRIIVTTKGMQRAFADEGVPLDRMTLVSLWTEVQHGFRRPAPEAENPPFVVYAGTIGPSQPLAPLLEALAILQRDGVRIGARIAGDGAERASLTALSERLRLEDVRFLGPITPDDVSDLVRRSTAHLVPLVRHPRFADTIPSKLFGAIGAGVPILAGLEGEARALALECGLGLPYASDDPQALAEAIRRALALDADERRALAARAWEFYTSHLSPDTGLARMIGVIDEAAAGVSAVRP